MNLESLQAELSDYLKRCGVPQAIIPVLANPNQTLVLAECERWWMSGEHTLLLLGGAGAGKTFSACSMLRHNWRAIEVFMYELGDMPSEYRWRGGVFVDMAELSQPHNWDQQIAMRDRAQNADFAILDDTGREKGNGAQALEAIYLARHASGRRTILTTNLDVEQVRERLGARVLDRASKGGTVFNCGTVSLRK